MLYLKLIFLTNVQVYTGKEAAEGRRRQQQQEKGLGHRVVMELAKPYYGTHMAIFTDNFYTGIELLEDMRRHGLYGCGTVRANRRGLPKEVVKAPLRKHQYAVAQKEELTFCVWRDTKTVMVLSNYHDPKATGSVNRRTEGTRQTPVAVPTCLSDYQKYMKGLFDLFFIDKTFT